MRTIKVYSNTYLIDSQPKLKYFSLINQPLIYFTILSISYIFNSVKVIVEACLRAWFLHKVGGVF